MIHHKYKGFKIYKTFRYGYSYYYVDSKEEPFYKTYEERLRYARKLYSRLKDAKEAIDKFLEQKEA